MRARTRGRPAAVAAVVALVAGLAASATGGSAGTTGRVRPTHFGVGVQATIDSKTMLGWMPRTGAPIDYAYRYLGGGLNTGKNWTDWEPRGRYPIRYAQQAHAKGYTPVFTYYNLLATKGHCAVGCTEARTDLTNLNDPTVMQLYFRDFATLMQRLGTGTYDGVTGYGRDAIVHIEPDLSGYAQNAVLRQSACFGFCSRAGNDPSNLRAAVATSGFPLAAASANTYRGFNQVLLKLRDRYAPKVRLALHVSNWTTGYDLNSSTDPRLDATALGRQAGAFAAASGATWSDGRTSTYDLLFNDVSNKDAAYYTYALRKPRFWDQDNAVFPNFHRWERYLRAVTTTTRRKAIVWQVPIGNQLYRSQNNSHSHWQDNRVEYLFGHVRELVDAGLVGMMFGTTIPEATNYWDAAGDGVTNMVPVCTKDGWSSGRVVCSTATATVADDDGGLLRRSIQAYYRAPLPV